MRAWIDDALALHPSVSSITIAPTDQQDNDKLTLTDPTVAVLLVAAFLQAAQLLALGPMVNEAMRTRNRREKEEGFADVRMRTRERAVGWGWCGVGCVCSTAR